MENINRSRCARLLNFYSHLNLGKKFNAAFLAVLLIAGFNVLRFHNVLTEVDGVAETINVAGRLRMLSQKIAFESITANHDPEKLEQLSDTLDDYEAALSALEQGGKAFGYQVRKSPHEFDPLIIALRTNWNTYRRDVETIHAKTTVLEQHIPLIADKSSRLLISAEKLVAALTQSAKQTQQHLLISFYFLFLVEAIIFGVMALVLRRRVVFPLVELARSARELADGKFNASVNFQSGDEIGELVSTFNLASQKIGQLIDRIDKDRLSLLQAESMFRGIAENSVVGVYIAQGDRFVFVNQMMADMFGYERETLLASVKTLDLFVEEDRHFVEENVRRRVAGEVDTIIYEVRGRHADGSTLDIEVFGAKMQIDGETATIGVMLDISTRRAQQQQLEYLANHDSLTGLANRNFLAERLRQIIASARRNNKSAAVLLLDLDNFKIINDSLGHEAGDTLLQLVAERLSVSIRRCDTVARFGGDEFVVLMPNIAKGDHAAVVAQKIIEVLTKPFVIARQEVFVGASIGISLYPQDGDADNLIKNADLAMYRAKQLGRNNFQFYSEELNARNRKRLTMENELRRALEANEFGLVYQPKICLLTGRIVGAEALIRWQHPQRGTILPAEFIPLAEETGMIVPLGDWLMQEACAQNRAWQLAAGSWQLAQLPPVTMAVNLSGKQFHHHDLVGSVRQILQVTQLPAHYLELELTETILMDHLDDTIALIGQMKDLGVKFSMDDFGTGYSSLNYLKRFQFDHLKLDKSFIRDVGRTQSDSEIVKTVIALGRCLGLKVIAEGVETAAQLAFLKMHGCDEAQGYFFSKPVSAQEFAKLLAANSFSPLIEAVYA